MREFRRFRRPPPMGPHLGQCHHRNRSMVAFQTSFRLFNRSVRDKGDFWTFFFVSRLLCAILKRLSTFQSFGPRHRKCHPSHPRCHPRKPAKPSERTMAASLVLLIPGNQSLVLADGITKCANANGIRASDGVLRRNRLMHVRRSSLLEPK